MAKTNQLFYRPFANNFFYKGKILKTILSLVLVLVVSSAFADAGSYYSADLSSKINGHKLKDDQLKITLFNLISARHKVLGYDNARHFLFGSIFLKNDGSGYYIDDVYCQKRFGKSAGVGKDNIPDGTKINCEHTWPQSKFTSSFPKDMQKSDLHHLFPTDSRANSIRGNSNFTEVARDDGELAQGNCTISKYGQSTVSRSGGFEPPLAQKGNTARAIFYFSVRYKMDVPQNEEDVLRRWNDLDPVDQEEVRHNDEIEKVQGNRNPFIDFPNLANDISEF